jgi:hypothetical protein
VPCAPFLPRRFNVLYQQLAQDLNTGGQSRRFIFVPLVPAGGRHD